MVRMSNIMIITIQCTQEILLLIEYRQFQKKKTLIGNDALSRTKGRQKTIETYKDGILNGSYMEYHKGKSNLQKW
jgi:hypothetical protein